jgi:polyhydroxybutyrate depolymerase
MIKQSRYIVIMVAALLVALVSPGSPAQSGSGSGIQTSHSFTYDGLTRSYLKYVPAGLPATPVPLVMVLHGGGESAAGVAAPSRAPSHWKAIADLDKFIVVYPDGVDNQWHDCRSDGHTRIGRADDVGFLGALIGLMRETHNIDLARVYSTGTSNGGMMSFRLASEMTAQIAAIGPNVANLPVDPDAECIDPTLPITVATINADADPLVPWNGGCLLLCTSGTVVGAEATRDYWIDHDQAASMPTDTHAYPDIFANDGPSTVTRYRHDGGVNGTQVAFFRVFSGGHNEPSTHHFQGSGVVGPQNRDIEMSEELWAIMKNHTRAGAMAVVESTSFNDGFESGNFTAGGWTVSGAPSVAASAAYAGAFGARIAGTSSITGEESTLGYSTVRLRFAWRTSGLGAGEYLRSEWSVDGSNWNLIKQTQETDWAKETFTLPPAAANHAGFRVRFSTNADSPADVADVDEVTILGNATVDDCGANTLIPLAQPERLDGAFAGTDDDGDTQVDEPLPGWAAAFDCDGDGWTGAQEEAVFDSSGGRDQDSCGGNGWPAELNSGVASENKVTLSDIGSFFSPVFYFNTSVGTNPGDERWDLIPNGMVQLQDVGALLAGATSAPAMLGGATAFNGPACPWAP